MEQLKRRLLELRQEQQDYKFRLEDLRRDELMGHLVVQERLQEVMNHLEELEKQMKDIVKWIQPLEEIQKQLSKIEIETENKKIPKIMCKRVH